MTRSILRKEYADFVQSDLPFEYAQSLHANDGAYAQAAHFSNTQTVSVINEQI